MPNILRFLTRPIEIIVAALLLAMVAALLLEVVLRFTTQTSLPWTSEFARYAMVWITFLGAALAIRDREHIQVTFFVMLLPKVGRRVALIAIDIVLLAFVATMLRYSVGIVKTEMAMRTAALEIPFGLVVLAMPIAGVLMIIYLLADIGALLRDDDAARPSEEAGPC
ncbi:TRAP transporter small permease [Acuticoccus kandeliae]|uniref:TRAP transporter small permease n=1 Tax=Acuticoccus kandeliae TaxID=2073160 RepID=UPI000D3E8109|nr:TRAP transporter small permease [Acuticoccus kandeliae]